MFNWIIVSRFSIRKTQRRTKLLKMLNLDKRHARWEDSERTDCTHSVNQGSPSSAVCFYDDECTVARGDLQDFDRYMQYKVATATIRKKK